MLDLGWSEMAVIALVALVVIGPKDLPKVMRTLGHWVRKARSVSREFQSSLDEMIREAELEDTKKAIQSTKNFNLDSALDQTIDPTGEFKKEVRAVEAEARDDGAQEKSGPERAPDDGGPDKEAVARDGEREAQAPAGATVIKHPAQPAPAHSLSPPKDEPRGENGASPAVEKASGSASGHKSA